MSSKDRSLTVQLMSVVENDAASAVVDILIANSGSQPLSIPVRASISDVEPIPFHTPYYFQSAVIYLSESETGLPFGSLMLYGSKELEGSLKTVDPGQSVEIKGAISRALAGGLSLDNGKQLRVKGSFGIDDDMVTQMGRDIHQSIQQEFTPVWSINDVGITLRN